MDMKNLSNWISKDNKHNNFYEVYTTLSWRNFMCLRCVHGPKCMLRFVAASALDLIIDLDQQMGVCSMFFKRSWQTDRMRYHRWNTKSEIYWYAIGILRNKRSRVMLSAKKSAFDKIMSGKNQC